MYETFENMTGEFVSATHDGPSAAALMLQSAISTTGGAIVGLKKSNNAGDLTKDEETAEVDGVTA